jgi:hypothetical protein
MLNLHSRLLAFNQQLAEVGAIAIVWRIADVREVRPDLSAAQARQVLQAIQQDHASGMGICWNTLNAVADELFGEPMSANVA